MLMIQCYLLYNIYQISWIQNFVGVCNFLVITQMQHKYVVLPLLCVNY